jgi:hypothetical protein
MSDNPDNKRHPESTFEAKYPYNQSTITRSGHEIHINDTPGSESLRVAHTKGSYIEIDKNGRTVLNSAGGAHYYFSKGFTTTVDGNYDLKVAGVQNVNVDGSINDVTTGNRFMNAGGDVVIGAGGNFVNQVVNDKYEMIGGLSSTSITFNENRAVGFDSTNTTGGVKEERVGQAYTVKAGGAIEMATPGIIRLACGSFIVDAGVIAMNVAGAVAITAGGAVTITTAAGPVSITSAGIIFINGIQVRINDLA